MKTDHENLKIENDLGTFEGFNHRTQEAIHPNITAQQLVEWDHDELGEAEFWHSGDNSGVARILTSDHVDPDDVIALDRLLSEVGDELVTLAKIVYLTKHNDYELEQLEAWDINELEARFYIDDDNIESSRSRTTIFQIGEHRIVVVEPH